MKQRGKLAAAIAGMCIVTAGVGAIQAEAQRPFGESRQFVLQWSAADSRPGIPRGQATGLFIWHDRNTVHVESTDNHWFGDDFKGMIEIRGGSFDNVNNEHDRADTRYKQVAPNRLVFHFNSQDGEVDGFKFNIHDGNRLIFHIGQNGHSTGRIFYGESKTPSFEDPVTFNLRK